MPARLAPDRISTLRRAPFTHPYAGATAGDLPSGYRQLRRQVLLPGRDLAAAADDLLGWRVHERAGLRVAASGPADDEAVVELRLGPLTIPCRVAYVVRDPDRVGFAYGTLPGHPESGEESFLLERLLDGRVAFTITAFSRPAMLLARLGGPVTRLVQDRVTARYLSAAARR